MRLVGCCALIDFQPEYADRFSQNLHLFLQ
jgi:hypothetical protein